MRHRYLKTEIGMNILETMGLMLVVGVVILASLNFLKKPGEGFLDFLNGNSEIRELTKKAHDEAVLVIVGKIIGIKRNLQVEADQGDNLITDIGVWRFSVESIERGQYPESEIDVAIGWANNRVIPQQFPAGLKKNYKIGDKVRVYISYSEGKKEWPKTTHYFLGLLYYCLEPVDS